MPRDRQQADVFFAEVHRDLPDGLDCVAMKAHTFPCGDLTDLPDRKNSAGFIVGVHHRYQDGLFGNCRLECFQIEKSLAVYVKAGCLISLVLQVQARGNDRRVFNHGGDEMVALGSARGCHPFDGGIIGFRGA